MHNLSTQSITSCGVVRVEAHTTPYYSSSPYFSLKVVGVLVVVVVPYVVVVVVFSVTRLVRLYLICGGPNSFNSVTP